MGELEKQQEKSRKTANRYGEIKAWLDTFGGNIQSGGILDVGNGVVIKARWWIGWLLVTRD